MSRRLLTAAMMAIAAAGGSAQIVSADARTSASELKTSTTTQDGRNVPQQQRVQSGGLFANLFGGSWPSLRGPSYPNGPGWTCAQVKRMARKARNQRRQKRAVRNSRK